jgi:cytochrome b
MIPAVGIGAGLVAALLFSVVITGSPLAVLLYSAAPLPVFIAALGRNHRAGLYASAAGALAVSIGLSLPAGFAFACIIALPAWWIAYLALLARSDESGTVEWYPLGHLMIWIAGTATLASVASALVMTTDYETYRAVIGRIVDNLLAEMVRGKMLTLPQGTTVAELSANITPLLVRAVPLGIAASVVTTITANLWLAAKTVQFSGRLPRPWPFIPSTTLPRTALPLLAAGLVIAMLDGFVGLAGASLVGALLAAFMFSGLCLLHDLSRGQAWRTPMLISVYVALIVMQAVLTPLLALAGMIDTLLGLRKRAAMPPPPPQA